MAPPSRYAWHALLVVVLVLSESPTVNRLVKGVCGVVGFSRGLCAALADNSAHSCISVALWSTVLSLSPPQGPHGGGDTKRVRTLLRKEQGMALAAGSLLDIDHFVSARSTSLHAATHLRERPWGHACVFVALAAACAEVGGNLVGGQGIRNGGLVATVLSAHQLRDAIRHGLWLWPGPSTPPVPLHLYVAAVVSLPGVASMYFGLRRSRAPRMRAEPAAPSETKNGYLKL